MTGEDQWHQGAKEFASEIRALIETIQARAAATESTSPASYTRELLKGGRTQCARKVGEEAIEVVIEALGDRQGNCSGEMADLIYHLLVLMKATNVSPASLATVLRRRSSQSGIREKDSRGTSH